MNNKSLQKLGIATSGVILSWSTIEANPAWAVTFTVDNTSDNGSGSLRQAILDADSLGGDNTINFLLSGPQKITLTSGELLINSNLTINGLGADLLTISGNASRIYDTASNVSRIFEIASGASVNISGLTITNGGVSENPFQTSSSTGQGQGGGIKNNGSLTLTSSIITGNYAQGGGPSGTGGGIYNNGNLTVTNSTISNNIAGGTPGGAGGIYSDGGTLTITNSTISGNGTPGFGGGIVSGGILTITNSTISNNSAKYTGGIASGGLTVITNSTITGNKAYSALGGGIFFDGTLELTNSTISGNGGAGLVKDFGENNKAIIGNTIIAKNTGFDVSTPVLFPGVPPAAVISLGYNLIGNGDDATGFNAVGDIVGTSAAPIDPKLGPLADNGGPTQTLALLPGSPAIDAANPNSFPPTDQRGVSRPQGSRADIGAFELSQTTPPKPVPESDTIVELGFLGLLSFFWRKKIVLPTKNRF